MPMMDNAEQFNPAQLFTVGKEGQREGRLSHQHKEHPPGQVLALLQKPIVCCLGCPVSSLPVGLSLCSQGAESLVAEEQSCWRALSRGSAAAAPGM